MASVDRISAALGACGITRLARRRGPLILMYHGIGGTDGVSGDSFSDQLEALAARRKVLPLLHALETLDTPEAAEVAAITFDDAYRDFTERAAPILRERGFHATVFVPVGHIGGSNEWDMGVAPRREIMSRADLRALNPEWVELGVHGRTHRRLFGLDEAALHSETAEARRELENVCGREVRTFAYPYGQGDDFDADAEAAVRRAGFSAACSTRFGRGSRAEERFRLRRVGIRAEDRLEAVERKLDGAYDWTAWKEALGVRVRRVTRRRERLPGSLF